MPPSAPRLRRAQSFRNRLLALILVAGQYALVVCQVHQKSEASDAIGGDSLAVESTARLRSWRRSSQSKSRPSSNFCIRRAGSKVSRACQSFSTTRRRIERLVERPRGEHAEIVDVARLVALIAGADFLGKDFGQRKADDFSRRERQESKITLLDLRPPLRRQRRRFAAADLQLDFAVAARVPVVRIGRIDAPGQAVLRLVVAVVGNGELDSVKRLLERLPSCRG